MIRLAELDLSTHAFYLRSYLSPGGAPWRAAAPDPVPPDLLSPAARVLDLGCGPGRNALALAAAGHPVVGVDVYPWVVRRARRRARALGLDGRARFVCAPASDLGSAIEGRFDVALDVLGPISDLRARDLPRFGRQLARRLTPGGCAYVHTFLRDDELAGLQPSLHIEVREVAPSGRWLVLRPARGAQDG